jgi:hypothetical protein
VREFVRLRERHRDMHFVTAGNRQVVTDFVTVFEMHFDRVFVTGFVTILDRNFDMVLVRGLVMPLDTVPQTGESAGRCAGFARRL